MSHKYAQQAEKWLHQKPPVETEAMIREFLSLSNKEIAQLEVECALDGHRVDASGVFWTWEFSRK